MTKPVIILVAPQMGENIGGAARAMFNFGLCDLRIVNPRDGWPCERADAMSSGALDKMPPVEMFEDTKAAIADCHMVYATTARPRDMVKPVMTPRDATADMKARESGGQKIAILFGGERAGLSNDDVSLAHSIITVPANPEFTSINLAQAVLLVAYEWFAQDAVPTSQSDLPAPQGEFDEFFTRLEGELEAHGFFRSPDMKPTTVRNLRSMLSRGDLTSQEVSTWHGILSALIGNKNK